MRLVALLEYAISVSSCKNLIGGKPSAQITCVEEFVHRLKQTSRVNGRSASSGRSGGCRRLAGPPQMPSSPQARWPRKLPARRRAGGHRTPRGNPGKRPDPPIRGSRADAAGLAPPGADTGTDKTTPNKNGASNVRRSHGSWSTSRLRRRGVRRDRRARHARPRGSACPPARGAARRSNTGGDFGVTQPEPTPKRGTKARRQGAFLAARVG